MIPKGKYIKHQQHLALKYNLKLVRRVPLPFDKFKFSSENVRVYSGNDLYKCSLVYADNLYFLVSHCGISWSYVCRYLKREIKFSFHISYLSRLKLGIGFNVSLLDVFVLSKFFGVSPSVLLFNDVKSLVESGAIEVKNKEALYRGYIIERELNKIKRKK